MQGTVTIPLAEYNRLKLAQEAMQKRKAVLVRPGARFGDAEYLLLHSASEKDGKLIERIKVLEQENLCLKDDLKHSSHYVKKYINNNITNKRKWWQIWK